MKRHLKLLVFLIVPSLFLMGLYGCDSCNPESIVNLGRIVFASGRDGDLEIYTMNPDGSSLTKITDNETPDYYPTLSKDGSKIVFVSERDGNPEIYTMNRDGTNQVRITNNRHMGLLSKFLSRWEEDCILL